MTAIKILIVDDHTVVRDGLSSILGRQDDFVVAGEARNGREAVQLFRDVRPDVILMDLRMPEMNGVESMREIREFDPDARFIVLTKRAAAKADRHHVVRTGKRPGYLSAKRIRRRKQPGACQTGSR